MMTGILMWYKIQNQQVILQILAKPNAKKTALLGISDEGLLISIHAKPDQGNANKELISYLSTLFRLPKSRIILQRGERSRHKQVVLPLTEVVQQLLDEPNLFKKCDKEKSAL